MWKTTRATYLAEKLFSDDIYIREVVFYTTLAVIPLWVVLGLDSGVGMIERAVLNLPLIHTNFSLWVQSIMEVYGVSFHLSTYVIYGLLFVYTSSHLTRLFIIESKNVIYSILLVAFNAMLFEWPYMMLMIHFQTGRGLFDWFIGDFFFLSQYLMLLMFGAYGLLLFLSEKKTFTFNWKQLAFSLATVAAFLLWVYYPLPVQTATFNGWTSNNLFPQTHYAYVNASLYVPNDLLHMANVGAKALLALTQLQFIRGFRDELGL